MTFSNPVTIVVFVALAIIGGIILWLAFYMAAYVKSLAKDVVGTLYVGEDRDLYLELDDDSLFETGQPVALLRIVRRSQK